VDGELAGADLDRASAHLASCERCRGDAAALRALKSQLRDLGTFGGDDALTTRLLAMAAGTGAGQRDSRDDDNLFSPRSPRRRYLMWGAVSSLAVVGGVGAAAFSMGGAPASVPGPAVVPQVETFNVEQAVTTGDVPPPGPIRPSSAASAAIRGVSRAHTSAARPALHAVYAAPRRTAASPVASAKSSARGTRRTP
jgi:anti-sigma factor RsiW